MAAEIQVRATTAITVYTHIRNSTGAIWNGTAFETYATANIATYNVTMTEQGTASQVYVGTFPSTIAAGAYHVTAWQRLGGTVAETDRYIGEMTYQWNGTAHAPISDAATSGQVGRFLPMRLARGVAISGFPFKMVSSADHVTNFTSGVVSGQIARDGGSFGVLQSGTISEMGLGYYKCNLTSGDLNADTVGLVFTGAGISGGNADQRDFVFLLQRVSGSTIT